MPRGPRSPRAGVLPPVLYRGHHRHPVGFDADDSRVSLAYLQAATATSHRAVHASVLMMNHGHLLMTPRQADRLAKVMQAMQVLSADSCNAKWRLEIPIRRDGE
jgi:putative transposase